jgi:hypothetical protein
MLPGWNKLGLNFRPPPNLSLPYAAAAAAEEQVREALYPAAAREALRADDDHRPGDPGRRAYRRPDYLVA